MNNPLAVRTLTSREGSPPVRLEIDYPRQATEDSEAQRVLRGEWSCEFRVIEGDRTIVEARAVGSDALEAIVNAVSRLRARFEKANLQAYWNEHLEGSGLPVYLPQGLGRDFDRHLRELVDKEVAQHGHDLEAKYRLD